MSISESPTSNALFSGGTDTTFDPTTTRFGPASGQQLFTVERGFGFDVDVAQAVTPNLPGGEAIKRTLVIVGVALFALLLLRPFAAGVGQGVAS